MAAESRDGGRRESRESKGAEGEAPDPRRMEEAAAGGSVEEFTRIVEKCIVSPYRTGMRMIHYASLFDLGGVFAKLVGSGERVDARTMDASMPVHLIAKRGTPDAMSAILGRFGANPNSTDMTGWTPLHCVVARSEFLGQSSACVEIAGILAESGADLDARTHVHGHTPLHLMARSGRPNYRIAEILVQAGCGLDCVDWNGMTPLDLARKNVELHDEFEKEHNQEGATEGMRTFLEKFEALVGAPPKRSGGGEIPPPKPRAKTDAASMLGRIGGTGGQASQASEMMGWIRSRRSRPARPADSMVKWASGRRRGNDAEAR